MDAYGTKIALDLKNCRKKLKKFEDAEKRRKEKEATFYKWADNYSKKKPGKMEMGADAVLRDLGIDPNAAPSLGEAVAEADAAAAPAAAPGAVTCTRVERPSESSAKTARSAAGKVRCFKQFALEYGPRFVSSSACRRRDESAAVQA